MKLLAFGIDFNTLELLRAHKVVFEEVKEEEIDLMDWLVDEAYAGALLNLDLDLGTMVCREIRKEGITTPVLGVMTYDPDDSMSWSELRTSFLENGGDDLLQIPFNPSELLASLRSCMRRAKGGSTTTVLSYADDELNIKLDQTARTVLVNGMQINFTAKEFDCLATLMAKPNSPVSKESLLQSMYVDSAYSDFPEIKIIDVFICKVKKKLRITCPNANAYIYTVWGKGYMFRTREINTVAVNPVSDLEYH